MFKRMIERDRDGRLQYLFSLFVLSAATLGAVCAYLQVLGVPFVYDDNIYITKNSKLAGLRLAELWRLFIEPYNVFSEFLPLRDLSYWLDLSLFGAVPVAFRLHNIALYLLCVPLVYGLTLYLWRYFHPTESASAHRVAVAVSALFVLHPSHTEAVTWIAGRKDVLSGMFSLLALWLAVQAKHETGISWKWAVASLFVLLVAMLSKATAVAVAPVIALLWILFWHDVAAPRRNYATLLWPLASLLLAVGVTLVFTSIINSRIPLYFGVEALTRTLGVQGWFARLAFSPEPRHFFYPVFESPSLSLMAAMGGLALLAGAVGLVVTLRKRSLAGFALIAFVLLCIPSLQLIPYAPPSLVGDRYIFLAVWPAMLLLVLLLRRMQPVLGLTLFLAVLLAWGYQTMERSRDWKSFESVIDSDLRAYPGYYMPAFQKIAWQQIPQGLYRDAAATAAGIDDPLIQKIMIGLIVANSALHSDSLIKDGPQMAMRLLWKLWFTLQTEPAQLKWNQPMRHVWKFSRNALVTEWEHLAKQFPEDPLVRYNAGSFMLLVPPYHEEALGHLRVATQSGRLPEAVRSTAYMNLGMALIKSGRATEAEIPLRVALQQARPDFRAHCVLAQLYEQTGRFEQAGQENLACPDRGRAAGEEKLRASQ